MSTSFDNAYKPAALAASLLLFSFQPAAAKDVFSTLMQGGLDNASYWDVSIGGGLLYAPIYEGSNEHELTPLPYLDINWNDTLFLNPQKGLGVNLFSANGFTFGTSAGYDFGRNEKDSRKELHGMGKIKRAFTGTAFLDYTFGPVTAESSLTKHFGGSRGVTGKMGLKTFIPLAALDGRGMPANGAADYSGPAMSLGLSTEWADGAYMKDFFGVNAAQSAASGKRTFKAESGFKSVSADIGFFVPVSENVTIGTIGEYKRLVGDAARSPVTRRNNQFSGSIFAAYKF